MRITLEEKLRGALVPKSQWLFTQIGRLENGVKFLVDMRVDLLVSVWIFYKFNNAFVNEWIV